MNSIKITGAILLLAVCAGTAAAVDCGYIRYPGGNVDFYGNDLTSVMDSTEASCIKACEANADCYAIVLKTEGTCWLKNSKYAMDKRSITNTELAVDMSCLRTGTTSPPVDPTSPPVDPTSPPVDPTSPPVDPTSPPVDPTSPPVDPTSPVVDPTSPPVDPTSPPVDPTSPVVDPTSPPVDPSSPDDGTGTDSPPASGSGSYTVGDDGMVMTTSTTELESGKYVTTEVTYDPKNYNTDTADDTTTAPTATSYYSNEAGEQDLTADAITDTVVDATVANTITATTTVVDQTDPLVTTIMTDEATGEPRADGGVMTTGGVAATPTESPPATTAMPAGTEGTIGTDDATGLTTMVNTVAVPNTDPVKYVTMTTVVNLGNGTVINKSAAYTDADGTPIEGADEIVSESITSTINADAVYPEPTVVSTVEVMDMDGNAQALTSSAVVDLDGNLKSYGANPLDVAAASPAPIVPSPPPTTPLVVPPPPPKLTVPVTPEKAASSGLQVFSAALALSVFGALMM